MRYVLVILCVFVVACSEPSSMALTSPSAQAPAVQSESEARNGSALPFKGELSATEAVEGSLHHLTGIGNATHLGRFDYQADIVVDEATGDGSGTVAYAAANGDRLLASTAGKVLAENFPELGLQETQIITGGTGRFSGASGVITVDRSLNLFTGATSGSFEGTVSWGH